MKRIYKQPIETIELLFFLFYIALLIMIWGQLQEVNAIKWTLITLAVIEFAYVETVLDIEEGKNETDN